MRAPWTWMAEKFAARLGLVTQLLPSWQEGRELPQPHDFQTFAEEGYRLPLVYACIQQIATSVAEPKIEVGLPDTEGTLTIQDARTHPLARLFSRPQQGVPDEQTTYELLESLLIHLYVAGNAYLHKLRNERTGKVVGLALLRPDRVEIVPGRGGGIESYLYKIPGVPDQPVAPADVVHFKFPNPADDYYGLSPIAVLARLGDLDTQGIDFLRTLFLNRGVPAGILKLQTRVPREERERIKALWAEEYGGFKGWNRLAVLDGGAEFQELMMRFDQLGMDAIFGQTETRICAVFGVPSIVIGTVTGLLRTTYANYETALRAFWIETLAPLYRRIGEKLTIGLAPEFDARLVIHFNFHDVQALQEDLQGLRQFAIEGWEKGLLKRNEARALVKQPPDPDGDVYTAWVTQRLVSDQGTTTDTVELAEVEDEAKGKAANERRAALPFEPQSHDPALLAEVRKLIEQQAGEREAIIAVLRELQSRVQDLMAAD